MKVFVNPVTKEEIEVTEPNHFSIYERYGYLEKKKVSKKIDKKTDSK